MRKNLDSITIYFGLLIEFLLMFLIKYSHYLNFYYLVKKNSSIMFKNSEAKICFSLAHVFALLFSLLGVLYIVIILIKITKKNIINVKKNTFYLFVIMFIDFALFLFDFKAILISSHAFRFVIICLITNLIVYIKYKKNNIDIK